MLSNITNMDELSSVIREYLDIGKRVYVSDERDWASLVRLMKGFGFENYQIARMFDVFVLKDFTIYEVLSIDPAEGSIITNNAYDRGTLRVSDWLSMGPIV